MGDGGIVAAKLALLAARASHRVEVQTAQQQALSLHNQLEEVVEVLMTQAEQFAESEDLPIIYSSFAGVRSQEDLSGFTQPARRLVDVLSAVEGKVQMSAKLTSLLSDTLSGFKHQCEELSLKVESLTHDFSQITQELNLVESAECRTCKRLLAKTSSYTADINDLRQELVNTQTHLADKQRRCDYLEKEVSRLGSRNQQLERELSAMPEFPVSDNLELQKELKQAEMTISDLENQLKLSQSQYFDSKSELEPRENALKKAQFIIKQLNKEVEDLVLNLSETEKLAENYKKEANKHEKSAKDAQIQLNSLEILKKTELRLRDEIREYKDNLSNLKQETSEEISRLKEYINQLIGENREFQGHCEELDRNLGEMEAELKGKEEEGERYRQEVNEWREKVEGMSQEMREMGREMEIREEEHQAEIAHIKRTAENTIRSLHLSTHLPDSDAKNSLKASQMPLKRISNVKITSSSVSSSQITTTAAKPPPLIEEKPVISTNSADKFTVDYWKNQLEEAIHRENALKSGFEAILMKNGSFLKERVKNLEALECSFRPEIERWMMKSEEMESHIHDLSVKLMRFMSINRDLQKMVLIKDRQIVEIRKIAKENRENIAKTEEILTEEVEFRGELLLDDVLPRFRQFITLHSSEVTKNQAEKHKNQTNSEKMNEKIANLTKKYEETGENLRKTEEILEKTHKELINREDDLNLIQKSLFSLDFSGKNSKKPSEMHRIDLFSPENSSRSVSNLLSKIENMQEIIENQSNEIEICRVKISDFSSEIEALNERKMALEREIIDLKTRFQSEKSLKDSFDLEKNALETLIKELKSHISTLETAHLGANQAKDAIQRKYDESLHIISRFEADFSSLKGENEKLIAELTNSHADVSALMVFKEKSKEQSLQIERLKDEIEYMRGKSGGEMQKVSLFVKGSEESAGKMRYLEEVLGQKENYIRELEGKLEDGGGDVEKTVKRKVAAYKRGFNKRLEEFEGVLHLIEDAFAELSEGHAVRPEWTPSSNPSLDTWTRALLTRISDFSLLFLSSKDRELRTYLSLLNILQSSGINEDEKTAAGSLMAGLQQAVPDLDFASKQVIILLKRTLGSESERRPVSRSGGNEDGVWVTSYALRQLLSSLSSLDSVEMQLIERKDSLLQISDELDALTHTLAETSIRSQAEVAGKMTDMFSKFSVQFLQDLKSDLQELGSALRDLREVGRVCQQGKRRP